MLFVIYNNLAGFTSDLPRGFVEEESPIIFPQNLSAV